MWGPGAGSTVWRMASSLPPPNALHAPRRAVTVGDAVLGIAVAVFATVGTTDAAGNRPDTLGYLLLVLAGLALVAHRRYPGAVFVVALSLQALYLLLGGPEGRDWLAPTVALASLTRSRGWRWTAPVALGMLVLSQAGDVATRGIGAIDIEALLVLTGLGSAIAVGEWLRTRDAFVASLQERSRLLELRQQDEAQRQVDAERLRLAREVHDTVAHALAAINVQAGVAEHVGAQQPERLPEVLHRIRVASSEALNELRATLAMARSEPLSTMVSDLARLEEVARTARHVGVHVMVDVDERLRIVTPEVGHAIYRIAQEAVTNTLRHADAQRLTIRVSSARDHIELLVSDDGRGGEPVSGHGLTGMRERAEALGGTLHAGGSIGGGFQVRAVLPLVAEAP